MFAMKHLPQPQRVGEGHDGHVAPKLAPRLCLGQQIRQQPRDHHAGTFVSVQPALDMHMRPGIGSAERLGQDLVTGAGTASGPRKTVFTHGQRLSQVETSGLRLRVDR
jgi:hypothetical protein